jgi:hypothetical protein
MVVYLRETFEEMQHSGYTLDCVAHACRLAEILHASGRAPWIGRIRDLSETPQGTLHQRLTPLRFANKTWTTHYVCCAGDEAFDPMAGEPLPLDQYGQQVFGRPLQIEEFLSAETTAALIEAGALKRAFRVYH